MARIDSFFVGLVYFFLLSPSARFTRYLLLGRAMLFTTAELVKPTRDIAYRSVIGLDLLSWAGYTFLILPLAGGLVQLFPGLYHLLPAAVLALPFSLRLVMYLVVGDMGHYWVHRLQHTRYFWRVHKWHHSPTYMYWLAGVRATLPHQFMQNLPGVMFLPLLQGSPNVVLFCMGIVFAMFNDWMHMNVTWRSNWLEWFLVTPRFHHIHHSDDPQYAGANMGVLFTFWDRLFGTYVDPESVHTKLTFGIGERENPVRLVLGI